MSLVDFGNKLRPNDPFASLLLADVEEGATYTYVGMVNPAGAWCIMRVVNATGVTRYAFGGSDYSTNWTGRAGLSYNLPTSA